MAKDCLFVYGTLRRDLNHPMGRLLNEHAEFLGEGTIQARLYDLGDYPGVVSSPHAAQRVRGEVYRLKDSGTVLSELDAYEGCTGEAPLYVRQAVPVQLTSGEQVRAWVYFYNRSVVGCPEIASGDYIAYRGRQEDI